MSLNPAKDYLWYDEYGAIDPLTWGRYYWDLRFHIHDGPYIIRASPERRIATIEMVKAACREVCRA